MRKGSLWPDFPFIYCGRKCITVITYEMHTVLYVLIIIILCICSSRSVISLNKCPYVYIFVSPFQENSTTCPATTAPPATPSSGLSIAGAIAIGVILGLLGVAVAVAIIVVVVVVVILKSRGVGKRSS